MRSPLAGEGKNPLSPLAGETKNLLPCLGKNETRHAPVAARVRAMLRAGGTGTRMSRLAHRMLGSVFALAWLIAATWVAAAPERPELDADAEVAAIERLLARGADAEALPRVEALISALPATAPASRQADLQLLLARTHGCGETRHDEAIAAATRAINGYGKDPAHAASALQARQVRGVAWARKREPVHALADLREVERVLRERPGAQDLAYAQALADLSLAQRVAADYGAALTSLENALAIHRRQPTRDPVALAGVLIRLGQTRRISGDLERAEAAYREALALDRAAPDPSGRNGATVLYALGNLYRNRDDPARAIPYYAEAVPAFERAWGADSVQLSLLYNNYGNAESLRPGRGEAAVALFQRALDIATRNRSEDPGHYYPLANIAMVRVWQGRFREAEAGFRTMLDRLHGVPAGSEISPLFSQHGLAAALWGQGRHAEAFEAAALAEATRQQAVREVATGLSDEQALAFQEQDYATLDHALAIALDSGDARLLERAWALAIGARGQVTAIQAERLTRARAGAEPSLQPLWQEWQQASAALDRAQLQAAASTRVAARERLERAERRLAQALPQARVLARGDADLAALRANLPADAALVWLHDLQHVKPTDFANAAVDLDDPDTWAFVLPAGNGAVSAIRLGPSSEIAGALADWQATLSTPASPLALARSRGAKLAALAWTPIARAVPAKRLFIVAEGPLLRMPWPALPDGDGYLVERDRQFHVLNHEHELLAATSAREMRHALLAVADPRGGSASPSAMRDCADPSTLPPLPGARREVERLATLFGEARDTSMLALVGEAASEARFRSEAPHSAVLHLATHGIEAGSGCAAGGTRGLSLRADESPPNASGASTALLLAAPATTAGGSADDGLLGSREIAALDLSGVQWAVLAACSTAAGRTHAYEGLYGLARAFRLAGARTVLLSLWPVDDDATAQWSEALYAARLHARMDTPAAMQHAQRAVLAARRAKNQSEHPWYWAGFIAIGDWH